MDGGEHRAGNVPGEQSPGIPPQAVSPTSEMYGDLDRAYRYYNEHLFGNVLPDCLITLRARGRTYGYFHEERFQHPDGRRTAEIALNPAKFGQRTIEDCISTLVHEQVHLWQVVVGTAPKRPYHNKNFKEKMEEIGLITSTTGEPGGARTGQMMSHYIAADGLFLELTRALLDDHFRARWADRFVNVDVNDKEWTGWQGADSDGEEPATATTIHDGQTSAGVPPTDTTNGSAAAEKAPASLPAAPATDLVTAPAPDADSADAAALEKQGKPAVKTKEPAPPPPPAAAPLSRPLVAVSPSNFKSVAHDNSIKSKSKWTCPSCSDNAWGKPSLNLVCGKCNKKFVLSAGQPAPEHVADAEHLAD